VDPAQNRFYTCDGDSSDQLYHRSLETDDHDCGVALPKVVVIEGKRRDERTRFRSSSFSPPGNEKGREQGNWNTRKH
jgi:hypothetical protein